jgi:integrase
MEPETRPRQDKIAWKFLNSTVSDEGTTVWGDVLLADLKRRHVKGILAAMSDTPHAGRHLLTVLRRMILVGLDEEWIESDPTYKLKHRPEYKGWKAWPDEAREKFEKRWPIGTPPRLAYCLALWLGNRRGDIAKLAPSAIRGDKIHLVQGKTGRALVLDVTPMLREVLDATDLSGPAVLMTVYGEPFSAKSLTGRMADWTKSAGLPPGYTLHGLRKTLGKMLAESGSTTREIMDTLGHTDIQARRALLARSGTGALGERGMGKVVRFVKRPKKAAG